MKLLTRTFNDFMEHRCINMSAALAYYTIFALPPLLFLLLTVLTAGLSVTYEGDIAEEKARLLLERHAEQMLGNQAARDEISNMLESNRRSGGSGWKTLISFVGILVSATGVVAAIQDSLNRVWSVKPDPQSWGITHLLLKRLLSLAMILGLGFLLLVSLVVSTIMSMVGERVGAVIGIDDVIAQWVNFTVQGAVTFVIFGALFKLMPDAEIRWADVLLGALLTTLLFLLGRYVLQWYLSTADPTARLGSAAASLAVILIWVYYSSMIFFLGAEATQAYAAEYGGGIRPEKNAVRVVETLRK
ncbi:YihY/virulence factor BrkB family protein [Roseiconus nitratireducens]|uniref:YihY/virulence factor BrkB family protein n=1 Tax=Roseiconus nitratireducens TaxID=2605748 RepID=A0A5M6D7Y4_9BACT|nr:YihY/virulence factor BrkB family protein [Roseiconus nitratireducens]KAA5542600.1 YihY/virulence factor BrkB family protein [Roseiconus nitratireducens]